MASTTRILLLLVVALILHLIEEVRAGLRERFPLGEMPLPLFVGVNVVVYGFCLTTLILSVRNGKLATPFAWIFAATMVLNGLGHVGLMAVRRRYVPGAWTALLLLALSGYLALHLLGVA